MMKGFYAVTLTFLAGVSTEAQLRVDQPEHLEKAVYQAVLAQHYNHPAGARLLLEPTTRGVSFPISPQLMARLSYADSVLLEEFTTRAKERISLEGGIGVSPTVFVTDSLRSAIMASPRWSSDEGAYSFSRVAFDRTRTKALVYVFRSCGGRCGNGGLIQLEYRDGKWEILRLLITVYS
jgi:hypothetical protein